MKKTLIAFAVFAAALGGAQSVSAAVQNLGSLSVSGVSFSDLTSATSVSGGVRTFSDTLNFSLDTALDSLTFTISGFERQNSPTNWASYNFESLSGSSAGFTVTGTDNSLTFTSTGSLAVGSYSLSLLGTRNVQPAAGTLRYDVSYTAVASPVPEPETYALMLAGLGVVGWAARRRKQGAAAPAQALPA